MVRGRKAKIREDTKTYIDNIKQCKDNMTVRTGCRRPQPLETTRQSSDGGQRSHMICRKEETRGCVIGRILLKNHNDVY